MTKDEVKFTEMKHGDKEDYELLANFEDKFIEGTADRIVRVLAGAAIFYVGVVSPVEPIWWGYIGLITFITGIIGWCPVYCPFGIKTNK